MVRRSRLAAGARDGPRLRQVGMSCSGATNQPFLFHQPVTGPPSTLYWTIPMPSQLQVLEIPHRGFHPEFTTHLILAVCKHKEIRTCGQSVAKIPNLEFGGRAGPVAYS